MLSSQLVLLYWPIFFRIQLYQRFDFAISIALFCIYIFDNMNRDIMNTTVSRYVMGYGNEYVAGKLMSYTTFFIVSNGVYDDCRITYSKDVSKCPSCLVCVTILTVDIFTLHASHIVKEMYIWQNNT